MTSILRTTILAAAFLAVPVAAQTAGGWFCYGLRCAGTDGVAPSIALSGSPVAGRDISIVVSDGLAATPGVLLLGLGMQPAPLFGCTLHVSQLLPFSVPFHASETTETELGGTWRLTFRTPENMPPLTAQAFLLDPGASSGFAATGGLGIIPARP